VVSRQSGQNPVFLPASGSGLAENRVMYGLPVNRAEPWNRPIYPSMSELPIYHSLRFRLTAIFWLVNGLQLPVAAFTLYTTLPPTNVRTDTVFGKSSAGTVKIS